MQKITAEYFSNSLYLDDLVHCGMTEKDAGVGVRGTLPQTEGGRKRTFVQKKNKRTHTY